jgi:hypothetical protein
LEGAPDPATAVTGRTGEEGGCRNGTISGGWKQVQLQGGDRQYGSAAGYLPGRDIPRSFLNIETAEESVMEQ